MDERTYSIYRKFIQNKVYGKALDVLAISYAEDPRGTYEVLQKYRRGMTVIARGGEPLAMEHLRRAYQLSAREHFDDFCIFTEWDRPLKNKFYQRRRRQLYPVARQLQRLADDELDILCISMPPGVGKTALATFFLTWLAGRNPLDGMLIGSHNSSFLRGIYDELLREMDPEGEYLWNEVFPEHKVVRTNALDMKIDVDKPQRFSTFQMASVGAGNSGRVRAIQLLYCDDLIEGIEEALSAERLAKKFDLYATDLRQRKQGECKELHISTRWSVHDIIGRLKEEYGDDDRAAFLTMPALNAKDKSNFDYGKGIGFSTKFYHDLRKTMDDASFRALYLNEPVERTGVLFDTDTLRRYFDLPAEEPDAIWAVCDTKDRGADYCVMPVAYQYGEDYYIESIVCDNGAPELVEKKLVERLLSHRVKQARFESNSAGGQIAQKVQALVKERGGITKINTKYSTANKETRILADSPYIKEHFLFKDNTKQDVEYAQAMNMLCGYTMNGKNKHDDVPDAMSMLANFVQGANRPIARVMVRPF